MISNEYASFTVTPPKYDLLISNLLWLFIFVHFRTSSVNRMALLRAILTLLIPFQYERHLKSNEA